VKPGIVVGIGLASIVSMKITLINDAEKDLMEFRGFNCNFIVMFL
jgi:hypothetical protein